MPETSIAMTIRENFIEKINAMRSAGGRFSKELDEIEARAKAYGDRMDSVAEKQAKFSTELADAQKALNAAKKAYNESATPETADALEKAQFRVNDVRASMRLLDTAVSDTRKGFTSLRDELRKIEDASADAARAVDSSASSMREDIYVEGEDEGYGKVKTQLDAVTTAMRGVRTEYGQFNSDLRRMENNSYGTGAQASSLSMLARSGIGAMLGRSLSGAANTYIGSAYDEDTGTYISGILGGAASGAAMGSLAGPWGTLVGALAGGISGLISSATEVFTKQDDAFKSYVQEQYEALTGAVEETLSAGSTVAGSREQTRLAFEQRFGSADEADDYLERVRSFANETNYDYDEIVGYSKLLLNSYDPEEVFGVLQSLSDASAALNLEGSDVTTLISGLSRMRTTGKTTQEYLNFFSERGIDVYEALSRSTGAKESEIPELVTGGDIAGADAAAAILDYIDSEFGGLSERLAGTYDAMVNNLQDAKTNLDAVMGEAYNEARKPAVEAEQQFYQSEAMEDAYAMIGSWKASLENLKEEMTRDALNAVMGRGVSDNYWDENGRLTEAGEQLQKMAAEYQELLAEYEAGSSEAGAKMGALLAEAQAIAQNAYNTSDGYKLELQSQLDLVDRLQKDAALQDDYWNAGYIMGQKFSEGLKSAQNENAANALAPSLMATSDDGTTGPYMSVDTPPELPKDNLNPFSHADGLTRVPFDDYPALLHQDERVLTVAEAEEYDAGRAASHADGLTRVPYDDYPAILHQDERVLTAAEAREYDVGRAASHADGLTRVPFDDYPALLHQDERVLTAVEARSADAAGGGSVTVTVTGNTFNVRSEADIDAVASAIAERVAMARRLM